MNTSAPLAQKIIERKELAALVTRLKQAGHTIVTTNGSFDLLHFGHVTMLQEAKSLGDILIVGVNSDRSVQAYKGTHRPLCSQTERVNMLAALACTDYITIFDELTPLPLLDIIRPHIHVNSSEHGKDCVERDIVEQHGGRIHLAQLVDGLSTTQLIERIIRATNHQAQQGLFLRPSLLVAESASSSEEIFHLLHDVQETGFRLFLLEHAENRRDKDLRYDGLEVIRIEDDADAIITAAKTHDVSLAKSYLVSEIRADIMKGRAINCKTILVQKKMEAAQPAPLLPGPNYIITRLLELPAILLQN